MGIDGVLVGGGQEEGRKGYLQLALIPFDPLGGAVTLASHHLAHVGMAVALAGCQTERERERDPCFFSPDLHFDDGHGHINYTTIDMEN